MDTKIYYDQPKNDAERCKSSPTTSRNYDNKAIPNYSDGIGMSRNVELQLNHRSIRINNNDLLNNSFSSESFINSFERHQKDFDSRATPKQVFPNISCLQVENNIILCFILSVWDNIVGPQTVYVWKKIPKSFISSQFAISKEKSELNVTNQNVCEGAIDEEKCTDNSSFANKEGTEIPNTRKFSLSSIVKYVTEHTVNIGESSRWKAKKMNSFLLLVPDQEVIVLSVRFQIIEDGLSVPYCLSAVLHERKESLSPSILNLCSDSMYRISAKIRLLISKEGLEAGERVRGDLLELCDILISLRRASLSRFPVISLAKPPDDRNFAEKILTSHLQTMESSLIIADSPSEANKIVMWLGQFLSEADRKISRIAFSDELWSFQPGLSVQAVIRNSSGTIDLSSCKLLASQRPLTLVDLNSNTVRQMPLANVHSKNSCASLRMELLGLWHDLEHVPAPSQSLFESVVTVAPLVKRFLSEWDRLASCDGLSHRSFYQRTFRRCIKYTALAIITWFENEWVDGNHSSKSPLASLASTFQLEDADLKIYLAEAERLKSGFTSCLLKRGGKT